MVFFICYPSPTTRTSPTPPRALRFLTSILVSPPWYHGSQNDTFKNQFSHSSTRTPQSLPALQCNATSSPSLVSESSSCSSAGLTRPPPWLPEQALGCAPLQFNRPEQCSPRHPYSSHSRFPQVTVLCTWLLKTIQGHIINLHFHIYPKSLYRHPHKTNSFILLTFKDTSF